MITISAFGWVPPDRRGRVRDLRVRWALEEAGLPYRTRLLEQGDQDKPGYRELQPFGQVPILEEDGNVLFESGAIVLFVGERSESLLPRNRWARARAVQWVICAVDTVQPHLMQVASIDLFHADQEWARLRREGAVAFARRRVVTVGKALGDKPYLEGRTFTAGDLMMSDVLRIRPDLVTEPNLRAYVERCTARPAFQRALAAQLADYRLESTPSDLENYAKAAAPPGATTVSG